MVNKVFLDPIVFDKKDEKSIFDKISKFINEQVYDKLGLNFTSVFENSNSILIDLIKSGKIQIIDNVVIGKINSKIANELRKQGAFFDKRVKKYRVDMTKLNVDILSAIADFNSNFNKFSVEFIGQIEALNIDYDKLNLEQEYDDIIKFIDKKFDKTTKDSISVAPEFTKEAKNKIAENYTNNMKLQIKDFLDYEIKDLRETVSKSFAEGKRYDFLVDFLMKKRDISIRKARFLAKQETNLISAEYRQIRYEDAGLKYYQWSTSGMPNVRESHKVMNNKICKWDDPKAYADNVSDVAKGKWKSRNNIGGVNLHPQQDYNCNCVAKPILIDF